MKTGASVFMRGPQALTIVVAALSLVVTGQVAASMDARNLSPETVLRIAPGDAGALARQAETLAKSGNGRASIDSSRARALRALDKEPTQIIAVRAAALAAAQKGDLVSAGKIFGYAGALTKRDLITHIWFIEAAAADGDIPKALQHYDLALRTSRAAGTQLFPVLAHATSDPAIAQQLATMLAANPPWASSFYTVLIGRDVPPETVARFIGMARSRGVTLSKAVTDGAINNLAAAGRADLAWSLYTEGAKNVAPLLRNGNFDRPDDPIPFDWQYPQDGDISASREGSGGTSALTFRAEGGATGEIARQLLVLAPGRYQLSSSVKLDEPDRMRLEWQITCVGAQQLLTRATASSMAAIDVPAGCNAQWLALKLVETGDIALGGQIMNVRLRTRSAS